MGNHNKLAKSAGGDYGRHEWTFLGTDCGSIQRFCSKLAASMPQKRIAYVDADHKNKDADAGTQVFAVEYTDNGDERRILAEGKGAFWEKRFEVGGADLVLINGNHFAGERQIVFLDKRKFDSLARHTDRLTNVQYFLHDAQNPNFQTPSDLPEKVRSALPYWASIPVLDMGNIHDISTKILEKSPPPPLSALLLAGGRSVRMGRDKALIEYQASVPQWKRLYRIIENIGLSDIKVSCRPEQAADFEGAPQIHDTFYDLGPMGAILSAFRAQPDTAWLVLACDLPLMDAETLQSLVTARRSDRFATAYRQPTKPEFPEPLVAIWEPRSYAQLLLALGVGISCPRKVLMNLSIAMMDAASPAALTNVNTPEELQAIRTNQSAG
jgi:molybdenum cofactor guanylyltransferase